MKLILSALLFVFTFNPALAADGAHFDLAFSTQAAIIDAMIESEEAQNNYVGEASFADVIERDLRFQMAGNPIEGTSVTLKCEPIKDDLISCRLTSYNSDEFGESALVISAKVRLPALSTKVYVYDVSTLLAG